MEGAGAEREGLRIASRRAEAIDWLSSLVPELGLPAVASEEEFRARLIDGTVFCSLLHALFPETFEMSLQDGPSNVKLFLSVLAEIGLSGFSLKDLEEGSMSVIVECLLDFRDNVASAIGNDVSSDVGKSDGQLRKKWRVPDSEAVPVATQRRGTKELTGAVGEERRKGLTELKGQQPSRVMSAGQKFREVFQIKRGSYSDLPAARISEMMHSNSLDNATTQSLLSVVNGILDESIERKKGEIPHRVVYLLRKVVQEIERRISTQAEHIRNQNNVNKAREDKYRAKIKALETLVNGTNEENQIVMNRLESKKAEKSKFEEKSKLAELEVVRLMKEKQQAESVISKLKQDIEVMRMVHEQKLEQVESKAQEIEAQLAKKINETEHRLAESEKNIEAAEISSKLNLELWNKKETTFWNFVDKQNHSIKDLRVSSDSIRQEMLMSELQWREEFSKFGIRLKGLVDAAESYHRVIAENQRLFNEVQELKGNIRVYCRVRPFLAGQDTRATTIDYIGENGELLISNPFKQGKDVHRTFKFNKVFGPLTSQAEVFADIQPLIRSVLDGYNVCIFAYGQTGSGKTYTMSGPGTSKEDWGVNYRALNDLFDISLSRRNAFLYEVGVQMVEIYNEQVRDLLSNDAAQKRLGIWSTSQPNGLVVPDASLHPVNSTSDVLYLMEIGQANRAVGSTALNERSSRSHSILTVHVRGADLKNGSTSRGCLHLIDLAGSERVERSEATGERLKEAQHINRSLSALGDVIFALAQKNAHVPYRNSKLTQVLQSSLGGQAKTLMFVQINPDVDSYSETISTLKFAERVSGVELGAARSNREGKDIKDLLEQVASLKDTIARKDTEIEQLQHTKDHRYRPTASLSSDRYATNVLKHSSSAPASGIASLDTTNQQGQLPLSDRGLKYNDRASLNPQVFIESDHNSVELNGSENVQTSPTGMEIEALGETDYEERGSNGSDDGFSVGETDCSIASTFEVTSFTSSDKPLELAADKMAKVPSRLPRSVMQKNASPAIPRMKLRDSHIKTTAPVKSSSTQAAGSAAKPPPNKRGS